MRTWTDAAELRSSVLARLNEMGWAGDARGIEEGRLAPGAVAAAFAALNRSATPATRAMAADLFRLAELEGARDAA